MRSLGYFIFLIFSGVALAADGDERSGAFGGHNGYLFDVRDERTRKDIEMVMLARPKDEAKPLKDVIFNEKLSKEFQAQYQYRFGHSQAEQVLNTQARSDGYNFYTGQNVTIQEYQKQQRNFGEYMARRLIEFHVDNWAKNDPDFKPVYALKEKVSNLNVTVKKGYKVKWKYNFAGPNMEFKLENPQDIEAKVRMEMSGILSSPLETIYSFGKPLTSRVYLSALYRQTDQQYQLVCSRQMTKSISMSLSGSADGSNEGASGKQNLVLVGLGWSD